MMYAPTRAVTAKGMAKAQLHDGRAKLFPPRMAGLKRGARADQGASGRKLDRRVRLTTGEARFKQPWPRRGFEAKTFSAAAARRGGISEGRRLSAPESAGGGHVRRAAIIAALLGLVLATVIIVYFGFDKVVLALEKIGWRGLAGLCVCYLVPVGFLAAAWLVLDPGAPPKAWFTFYFARLVRDASGELLPFSSLGGFVFGARAAILGGVEPAVAISTTVVDVTAEFIGQLGFTALGIALLFNRPQAPQEDQALLQSSVLGLGAGVLAAAAFILLQRRATGPIERAVARWAPSALAQTSAVVGSVHALYQKPARLTVSSVLHLAAWVLGGVGVWAGLWFAGRHMSLRTIMGVESLVYVVRTITFAAPMGLGVIEGGYVVVGALFGLTPEFALALSLIKRVRDIVIGLPALALWQAMEGRRLLATKPNKSEAPGSFSSGPP
jgi:putative membrane protein